MNAEDDDMDDCSPVLCEQCHEYCDPDDVYAGICENCRDENRREGGAK